MKSFKPIICLDFDGVIHGYQSGWKGARNIPDPPVPGALNFILEALEVSEVHVLSSRSHAWFGRMAMKHWLKEHFIRLAADWDTTPILLRDRIANEALDPYNHQVANAADLIIKQIKWPLYKPPAIITIDDRAIRFTGQWQKPKEYLALKPWNK